MLIVFAGLVLHGCPGRRSPEPIGELSLETAWKETSFRDWLDVTFPGSTLRAPQEVMQRIEVQRVRIVGEQTPPVLVEAMRLASISCSYQLNRVLDFVSLHEVIVECMGRGDLDCTTNPDELLVIYVVPVPPEKIGTILLRLAEADPRMFAAAMPDEGFVLIADSDAPTEGAEHVLEMVRATAAAP